MAGASESPIERAATIAARALLFLACEPARLDALLQDSGLTPEALRAGAGDAAVQAGILAHLLGQESLLLVFSTETAVSPQQVEAAAALLEGSISEAEATRQLGPPRRAAPRRFDVGG